MEISSCFSWITSETEYVPMFVYWLYFLFSKSSFPILCPHIRWKFKMFFLSIYLILTLCDIYYACMISCKAVVCLTTSLGCLLGHSNLTCQDRTLNFPPETCSPSLVFPISVNGSTIYPSPKPKSPSGFFLFPEATYLIHQPSPPTQTMQDPLSLFISQLVSSLGHCHNQKFSCSFTPLLLYGVYPVYIPESRT